MTEEDWKEKYTRTQIEMWAWRDKYLDLSFRSEQERRRRVLVLGGVAAAAGALGYAAGVLRARRPI